jgi:hypothetical protein
MRQIKSTPADERIIDAMIDLARCSKRQRILVGGSKAPHRLFDLNRRGFNRVATTSICGLPCGQYDAALVEWQASSIKALESTLDWLVHFLAPEGVLAIWVEPCAHADHRKLVSALERLGFLVEAGTRCENGLALSARRRELSDIAKAA